MGAEIVAAAIVDVPEQRGGVPALGGEPGRHADAVEGAEGLVLAAAIDGDGEGAATVAAASKILDRVPVMVQFGTRKMENVDFNLKGQFPLGAALQALQDAAPGVQIYVRDYGLLVTTKDRMPEDALRLRDFLRQTAKPKDDAKPKQ